MDSSRNLGFDDALNSLTGHLLHDHLGLEDEPDEMITNHAALADVVLSSPSSNPGQDVEMRDEGQCSNEKQHVIPLDKNAKQDDTDKGTDKQQYMTTVEAEAPVPEIGDSRTCSWRGCGRSFESVDDLTNHLTAKHVGSGKNHYECFWGDCERNGEKGFSSKQKVCRHLQVCIYLRLQAH